ncbi:MAG: hypothetical protein RI932_1533 [Pseudomonadota bacterium]|jgi:hypothetical protein
MRVGVLIDLNEWSFQSRNTLYAGVAASVGIEYGHFTLDLESWFWCIME